MATYVPVTVVASGGAPFVQVSGNAPPMTVVDNAAPITLVANNAPPVVLYNPDGTPYTGGGYDPATIAYFAAMTDSAGLTTQQKGWINDAVVGWKGAGLWPLIGHLCLPLHDSQASRVSLKNPAIVETALNSPAFTAFRGFLGDGVAASLNSNYLIDGSDGIFIQDSASVYAYINATASDVASLTVVAGMDTTTGVITFMRPWRPTNNAIEGRVNGAATSAVGVVATRLGGTAISRTGAAVSKFYRNGLSLGSDAAASGAPQAGKTLYWLRLLSTYASDRIALRMAGAGMTEQQMSDFHAIALTLITNLGAN